MDTPTITDALIACLPPVAYAPDGEQVVREFGATAAPIDDAVDSDGVVLAQVQPDLADVSLADWERNYGLPDVPSGAVAPVSQRIAALLARINQQGNLSRAYIVASANAIGFPGCTITEFEGMSCDDPCDSAVNDDRWIGVWQLNVPAGYAGDIDQLRRLIARRKPAHTIASINIEGL